MKLLKKITAAAALALSAALLAPAASAACPYTVGPLGRYIVPAEVQGMTATDDGAVEVWCSDLGDGGSPVAALGVPPDTARLHRLIYSKQCRFRC